MRGVNFKQDTTEQYSDGKCFRFNLHTTVCILLILATTISLSFSFPISSEVLNFQLANAAIQPTHTFANVHPMYPSQAVGLQFFPSNSNSLIKRIAIIQYPSARYPFPFR